MWKHDYSSSSSQMRWETISWSNNIIRLEKPEARNEILTVALLKVIPLLVQGFLAQTQATKGSQSEKCSNISRGVERKDMSSVHISSDTFFFFTFTGDGMIGEIEVFQMPSICLCLTLLMHVWKKSAISQNIGTRVKTYMKKAIYLTGIPNCTSLCIISCDWGLWQMKEKLLN